MKGTPWWRIRGQNSVNKKIQEIVGSGKPTGSVLKEAIAVSVTISISVQNRHSRILLRAPLRGRMREMHREPEVPEEKVPVVECVDSHAAPSSMLVLHVGEWMQIWEKCSYAHRQVEEQHKSKRSRKNGDKSAVAMLKRTEQPQKTGRPVLDTYSSRTRQLGCVCQDLEPRKSSPILRKSSNIQKSIRCVKFTKAVVRHADIRDQNPSLAMICPGDPHQRNPNAPKF